MMQSILMIFSWIDLVICASALEPPLDKSKHKKIRLDTFLRKWAAKDLLTPFKFVIMEQLANIPSCITMHELLRLSKETRDALCEILADSETFLTQVPLPTNEECCCCHQVSSLPNITFVPKDMLMTNPNND